MAAWLDNKSNWWYISIGSAMVGGALAVVVYSYAEKSFSVFACALLIGLAASLVGGLTGFIFGIPRTVSAGTPVAGETQPQYQGNTNLEQISDWLTKILVGAGLVELRDIFASVGSFGAIFEQNHALGSAGAVVAPAVAILNLVCGFLIAYLWARIYMIAELEQRQKGKVSNASPATVAISQGTSQSEVAAPAFQ